MSNCKPTTKLYGAKSNTTCVSTRWANKAKICKPIVCKPTVCKPTVCKQEYCEPESCESCEPCDPCDPCKKPCKKTAPKCELPCCEITTCDNMFSHNIYIFGSGYEDTGNWLNHYGKTGLFTFGPGQPVLPPRVTGLVQVYGPKKRFSNALNHIDYTMNDLGMDLINESAICSLPQNKCDDNKQHIINFAVNGATVNGNTYNGGTDANFNVITGAHGFNDQVAKCISLLGCDKMSSNDVVFYLMVGASDVNTILRLQIGDQPAAITTFVTTHVNNITQLYAKGCRRMIFSYIDGNSYSNSAGYQKINVLIPGSLAAAQTLANTLFDGPSGLIAQIEALLLTTLEELDINIIPASTLLTEWFNNPTLYGIRTVRGNDIDPRGLPAAIPFPTYYDMYVARDVKPRNTVYYDDSNFTDIMHRNLATIYINYLRNLSPVSKHTHQCQPC
jgi:hypothetical protein